jgi:hypothetical protein
MGTAVGVAVGAAVGVAVATGMGGAVAPSPVVEPQAARTRRLMAKSTGEAKPISTLLSLPTGTAYVFAHTHRRPKDAKELDFTLSRRKG